MSVSSVQHTDLQFLLNVDTSDPNNIYIGEAAPGSSNAASVWKIQKIVIGSGLIRFLYADGNYFFDNVWDNRTSLGYS